MSEGQWMGVVASLAVLALLLPGLKRLPSEGMLRNLAVWLALFALLGLLYNVFGPF